MKLIKDKNVFGWVMYDWANSAFATTIMAGFFPVFFKSYWSAGADVNESTAMLGLANSISSLIVALISPILGAIADQSSGKKRFLIFFAYLGALLTGCLFMVEQGEWFLATILYAIGNIGFASANTFYDSLLPDVANEKRIDFISAKGYAYGYLGGGLLFLANVLWFLMPATFGLPVEAKTTLLQDLKKDATVIQVSRPDDFQIPEKFETGTAVVTSCFTRPIRVLDQKTENNQLMVDLQISLPAELNDSLLDRTVVFGKYQHGTLHSFDRGTSVMTIENLTREITNADSAHFTLNNRISYTGVENDMLTGVSGLENHFGTVSMKTDFLNPPVEFLSIRLSFISVAIWWAIFTIPLILYVRERKTNNQKRKAGEYIRQGFTQIFVTFRKIRHLKVVFLFLLAYWLYIDGVDTIIKMAVDYGMSIGFSSSSLIVALLITQFVGFPSAILFGKLGEKWNVRKAIFITLGVYIGVTIFGVFMDETYEFYILSIVVGLVQGGVQALSRSYYSRLIPKDQTAEFYGFYNMLGKFATILGPLLIGGTGLIACRLGYSPNTSSRVGIASVSILFILGAILLIFVDEEKGKREVEYLSSENSLKI
ncbi:MAG: MFS transporter [Candidatus Marinimicrobia bacterium]|nr:MFS transporter [Candidatus Neomarinimicrobiota bacterium]